MKEEMKGLYAAVVLSIAVIFVTNLFFPKKPAVTPAAEPQKVELTTERQTAKETVADEVKFSVEQAAAQDRRVKIANGAVEGSIRVKGARFDELYLTKYKQTQNPDSPNVD